MPTDNIKTDLKQVGWYAVVHYGTPKDKQDLPLFVLKRPIMNVDATLTPTCKYFTADMAEAELFDTISGAEMAKETVVMKLTAMNHPLKDHIKILRLFGEIVTKPKEG